MKRLGEKEREREVRYKEKERYDENKSERK